MQIYPIGQSKTHISGWIKTAAGFQHPWEMTRDEFMKHHMTGHIPSHTYDDYNVEKVQEICGEKNRYPVLVAKMNINGMNVEFRQSGESAKYVKHLPPDEDGWEEIARDERGMALYLSDEEAEARGYPTKDITIHIFVDDICVGWIGESFGATELFIANEFQKRGIGTAALKLWLQMYPSRSNKTRTLGQMTPQGQNTAYRVHQEMVGDAVREGKPVPPQVRQDYEL